MQNKTKKINIISLGCSKNLVDSEVLMKQLDASGIEVVHDSNDPDARIVIINTCGFINDAKQESIDTILSYIDAKQNGQIDNVFVMGCLSERYKGELRKEIPEVDDYFGVNQIEDILQRFGSTFNDGLSEKRTITTPSHYAYLKIAEGCDRKCSFCAIPLIRGKYKSRDKGDLINEANSLADRGVKELILIAQDLSWYGIDIDNRQHIPNLLSGLAEIDKIEWIRLHYLYPANFPEYMPQIINDNPKICNYLDIPFQHISDKMLKIMRRGHTKHDAIKLIEMLRNKIPGIALRTTLLTGHPGETDEDFNELLEFVKEAKFERLGVFSYSHEEDTHSHKIFKDEIPAEVKTERTELIMNEQMNISKHLNNRMIGKSYKVLVDRLEGDYFIGRTEFDSPEIDNEVLIPAKKYSISPGEFVNAKIIDVNEFDLYAEVI